MMEIPDRSFNKIVIDLVTDFTESSKGNKHILTIIDLLTGWPEVILIPNKSADKITKAFIRHYLPRHMCPRLILSDNGTVQEPDLQQSHKGSWHREDILCTIPPTKQWKARNIPQIPQTNTKEDVCLRPR